MRTVTMTLSIERKRNFMKITLPFRTPRDPSSGINRSSRMGKAREIKNSEQADMRRKYVRKRV